MRILEVTHRYPPALGGVEGHIAAIAAGLEARGHSVDIVTTDVDRDRPFRRIGPERPPDPRPVRRHRAIRWFPAPHGLGVAAPGMAVDLLRHRADVVHAHAFGMAPTWFAAARRRRDPTPLVVETHADAGRGTDGWRVYARFVARATLAPADRVVVQTGLERALMVSLGVPPGKIETIPDGVDLSEFPFGGAPRPARDGPPVALFVGRLDLRQKGLLPLVRAVAALPSSARPSLHLAGADWGGAAAVRRLADALGIADRIEILGALPRSRLLDEYRHADLFVLPSSFEPFGIVLLEAMAAGLPVVASRVGGIPEVVEEGVTALLCPSDDPPALAAALGALTADEPLRRRLGAAGRRRAARFSWEAVIPSWIRLFEEVGAAAG